MELTVAYDLEVEGPLSRSVAHPLPLTTLPIYTKRQLCTIKYIIPQDMMDRRRG